MADILSFSDEAGDTGFPLKQGTSLTYVASTVFVHSPMADAIRQVIRDNKRTLLGRGKPIEWKNLPGSAKRDDAALAEFIQAVTGVGGLMLGSAIVDKARSYGKGITDPQTQSLTPYAHGLVFKRTLPYVARFRLAEFYMDRNSSVETQANLRRYLSEEIPKTLAIKGTVAIPKFISPKDDPLLQFADLTAGVTRVMFEDFQKAVQQASRTAPQIPWASFAPPEVPEFQYPMTYKAMMPFYARQLPRWRWDALIYHPYAERLGVSGFFPPLEGIAEAGA